MEFAHESGRHHFMEICPVDIEPMSLSRLDEVYAIEVSSYAHPWPYSSFTQELTINQHAHYYIALTEGKVIGYIGMLLGLVSTLIIFFGEATPETPKWMGLVSLAAGIIYGFIFLTASEGIKLILDMNERIK